MRRNNRNWNRGNSKSSRSIKNVKRKSLDFDKVKELEDLISNNLDIVTYMEEHGINVGYDGKIACPFHTDLSPSLFIDKERQLWHCMSCDSGGGYVSFVMEYNKILLGIKRGYHETLLHILNENKNILSDFSGSIYVLENIKKGKEFSLEIIREILGNYKKYQKEEFDLQSSTRLKIKNLKKKGNIDDILKYCILLQEKNEFIREVDILESLGITLENKKGTEKIQEPRGLSLDSLAD